MIVELREASSGRAERLSGTLAEVERALRERALVLPPTPPDLLGTIESLAHAGLAITVTAATLPTALVRAYDATVYEVEHDGQRVDVRPGRPAPELDEYAPWTIVTAHNPFSQPLDRERNEARQARLEHALSGRRLLPALGVGEDARWSPEPSLLVAAMPAEEARALGRRFGQYAVVVGEAGAPARVERCFPADPDEQP